MDKTAKRSKTSEAHVLPPCKVCAGKAVGFHFGVNVCAACKSFFKRMVKKPAPTQACDGDCVPRPGRAQCIYCRYARCVQAGMSTSAAKRGRYTQHMKVENLIAAKTHSEKMQLDPASGGDPSGLRLEAREEASYSSDSTSSPASNDMHPSAESSSSADRLSSSTVSTSPEDSPASGHQSSDAAANDAGDQMVESPPAFENYTDCSGNENPDLQDIDVSEMAPVNLSVPPATTQAYQSGLSEAQLKHLTEFLEKVFVQYTVFNSEIIALSLKTKYQEDKRLRLDLFGSLKPLEWEEYKRIHDETGLDIDGRKELIGQCSSTSGKVLDPYIGFCHDIPGFKDLLVEDQLAILKDNIFYFVMMLDYPHCNPQEKIFASPLKDHISGEDELLMYSSQENVDFMFELIERLQSLHLTSSERGLLTTLMILRPEHGVTPSGKQHLERAKLVLTDALRLQFTKTHPSCPHILQNALDLVKTMSDSGRKIFLEFAERVQSLNVNVMPCCVETRETMEDKLLIKMLKLTENSQL